MQFKKGTILVCCCLVASVLHAQGIRDSVFQIKGVEVKAERIFNKEHAGMKETQIDTAILSDKAILSLSDLLSENTPVFIKNHGRGALATASFRGSAPSHTRVNWNGINLNSPMSGMVDFSLIPVYIIDDLSLKHGPASMVNGGGGIGGSINIRNSVHWNEKTNFKYLQGIGSYKTFDEFLQLGFGNRQIRIKTRLYHNYSKNDYTFVNRGIGNLDPETGKIVHPMDTNDNGEYSRCGILQEVYYRPKSNQVLSLKYWGQFADRTIPKPTSYEGPDNSNLNNQQDRDHKVVADWNYFGEVSKLMLRTGYSGKQVDYVLKNRVPGLGLIPAVYSESVQRSFLNALSYSHELSGNFSIASAADINYHDVYSTDSVSNSGYNKQRFELSFFVSAQKGFADRLNLNLMLRQDWIDLERAPFIPYLGFDFRLIDGVDLLLKGNIARNYHQPSLSDLYWQPGGNPELLPEQGFSLETGLEYQVQFSGHILKTELTAYRSDIENWIVWIPSYKGYWESKNVSRVLSKGLEYSMTLKGSFLGIKYKFSGTYAYTSSVNYGDPLVWGDNSYGKQLVYIPLHSGNIMVNLSYRKYFITYQYNSYSERYTTSSNDLSRRDWLYPYFMNNVTAGRAFDLKKVSFSAELKIYNLFNESYHSILYRPMPGRHFNLLLMMKI